MRRAPSRWWRRSGRRLVAVDQCLLLARIPQPGVRRAVGAGADVAHHVGQALAPRSPPARRSRAGRRARRGWWRRARSSRSRCRPPPAAPAWIMPMSVSHSASASRTPSWPCDVAVRDDRERAAGEVPRIGPAGELERLGRRRVLAARRRRIGIAAVGAHQAVDHQLQARRRLVPVHRAERSTRRAPRPSAGRSRPSSRWSGPWRGSDSSCTASGTAASRSRRRPCRDGSPSTARRRGARGRAGRPRSRAAPRSSSRAWSARRRVFETLARAGVLAARRAVDDQDARRRRGILLLASRPRGSPRASAATRPAARTPDRQNPGTGGLRARRLAVLDVAVPGDLEDLLQLGLHRVERRVVEALEEALAELLARERDVLRQLAHVVMVMTGPVCRRA